MNKYLLVYHGGGMPETEEAREATMAAWGQWFAELGAAVIDGGSPTGPSVTVESDATVRSGGGSNPASGYGLIEAANIEAAAEMAKGCPILASGGSVEVCETFDPAA